MLFDIIMPKMDGYEVLAQLKADAATRDIPVIMISGIDEMESVVRCIQQGVEDYLPRPINTTLLKARAGASLEKKRLRDEEKRKTAELALTLEKLQAATETIRLEVEHIAAIQRALVPQKLPAIVGLDIAASYETFDAAGAISTTSCRWALSRAPDQPILRDLGASWWRTLPGTGRPPRS